MVQFENSEKNGLHNERPTWQAVQPSAGVGVVVVVMVVVLGVGMGGEGGGGRV